MSKKQFGSKSGVDPLEQINWYGLRKGRRKEERSGPGAGSRGDDQNPSLTRAFFLALPLTQIY